MRFLTWFVFCIAILAVCFSAQSAEVRSVITKAREVRETGDFTQAAALLTTALTTKQKLSEPEQKQLRYELDLLERMRADFSLTEGQLFARLEKAVGDITQKEFKQWLKEGRFEKRTIDGTVYFSGTSVSNLFWRHPQLEPRRITPRDKSALHRAMLENARLIKQTARWNKPYVLPHELEVTMTVTVKSNAVPPGEIIRAWLPIPRKFPFQDGFKLLESSSLRHLADESSSIRSAYLEQPAQSDGTKFQIKYLYSTHAIRFEFPEQKMKPVKTADKTVKQFTREAPHVVFTPEIKKLSKEIVGAEKEPVRKARMIYDWIGKNIQYSYALEYSTIPNISEDCRKNGYGDCGQQALLFITLCRSQGIPARWQSGWFLFPGGKNIHDWTEIYLEPHGWVPVDVEIGGAILQYATSLALEERKELHDFYFGGLDQYRLIANSDHSQSLNPPKQTFRSDDVDFQRGELEWGSQNIYFDKYSYDLQWRKVK
jgi:transglutaminase-like putative cysteine protease